MPMAIVDRRMPIAIVHRRMPIAVLHSTIQSPICSLQSEMLRVYFDHNATTPIDPVVAEAVTRALVDEFGNPSSVHHFGQRAKAVLDDARSGVAELIGAEPVEVVFTSGGTEAD